MDVLFDANTMRTHRLRGREGDNQHKDNSSGRLLRGESNTSLFAGNCCGSTQMAVSGLRLVVLLYLASAAFGQAQRKTSNTTMAGNMTMNGHGDHSDHGAHGGHGSSMTMAKALPVPDSCVKSPNQANCSTFNYPHENAVSDLQRLCAAMSFMAACSVAEACTKAGAGVDSPNSPTASQVSANNADVCKPFNLVITTCRLDTGMARMAGCDNYRSMCVENSPVPKCKMSGLTALPTTKALNTQVRAICEAKPTGQGCAECLPAWKEGKTWSDCNLLATYSNLCAADPSLAQCVEFHTMCRADSSLIFCKGYDDKAKKAADAVLKNKPADPESKQASAPAKSAAAISSTNSVALLVAVAAAAGAVLAL